MCPHHSSMSKKKTERETVRDGESEESRERKGERRKEREGGERGRRDRKGETGKEREGGKKMYNYLRIKRKIRINEIIKW